MTTISGRMILVAILSTFALAAGCQSAPSQDSGLGRIAAVAASGPWRAVVISIADENGTEVYSLFKRKHFQAAVDVPPGVYEITHTCAPSQWSYEDAPGQWPFPKWTTKVRLKAGDSVKLVAESGLTLRGPQCHGAFFVPRGQLIQANRLVE